MASVLPDHTGPASLPSLTGMRFFAALLVFCFHAFTAPLFADFDLYDSPLVAVFGPGFVGVSFFFVLSGFVLTWSCRQGDTVRAFVRRRLVKIGPNHLVMAGVALLAVLVTAGGVAPVAVLANIFLVHAWIPDQDFFFTLDGPSWSLSCELLFYLSFPLLMPLLRRIPGRLLWPAAVAAVAATFGFAALASLLPDTPMSTFPVSDRQYWFVYIFPLARVPEFVLGMLLARIVREGRWIRLGLLPASALAVVGYLAVGFVPFLFGMVAISVVPLALLLAAAAHADVAGRRSFWRHRWLVWLGEVSFAFYLVHAIVIEYGHALLGAGTRWPFPVGVLVVLSFFACSLLGAWLLYTVVERPCMRRFARPRRAQAAPGTAQPTGV